MWSWPVKRRWAPEVMAVPSISAAPSLPGTSSRPQRGGQSAGLRGAVGLAGSLIIAGEQAPLVSAWPCPRKVSRPLWACLHQCRQLGHWPPSGVPGSVHRASVPRGCLSQPAPVLVPPLHRVHKLPATLCSTGLRGGDCSGQVLIYKGSLRAHVQELLPGRPAWRVGTAQPRHCDLCAMTSVVTSVPWPVS